MLLISLLSLLRSLFILTTMRATLCLMLVRSRRRRYLELWLQENTSKRSHIVSILRACSLEWKKFHRAVTYSLYEDRWHGGCVRQKVQTIKTLRNFEVKLLWTVLWISMCLNLIGNYVSHLWHWLQEASYRGKSHTIEYCHNQETILWIQVI